MVKKVMIFCLFFVSFLSFPGSVVLNTDFQNTASKVIKNEKGEFSGICIDLMNLIEKNSNYKFKYPADFASLQRIEENLNYENTDVYFGLIRNSVREKECIFVEPLYTIKYVLVARSDDTAEIKNIEDLKKNAKGTKILTVSGSTIVNYISSLDLSSDSGGATVEANFDKLLNNRGRFMIYQDLAIMYDLKSAKYMNKFKIIPLDLKTEELWLVTSRKIVQDVRDDLRNIIRKFKASGDWNNIVNKYRKN
jgi:ABC-type amino acid transport substrate-binding protein